jgi:hypothetical protein
VPRRTPSRGPFQRKTTLSPRQSAHGLCARRRVARASARSDARAAVASFVLKVVNKAATSKADYKDFHFCAKGTVVRYVPSQRHRGARRRALQRRLIVLGRWLCRHEGQALLPWTKSMDSLPAVHCPPPLSPCGYPSRPRALREEVRGSYIRR